MRDTPGTWADYIAWAAKQVGGVAELARRTELARSTLFDWKLGRKADTPTVGHIDRIADATDGDRRRAHLAAAQLPEDPPTTTPASDRQDLVDRPTLSDLIAAINETGAPFHERAVAVEQVIAMFRHEPGQDATADDNQDRRTA